MVDYGYILKIELVGFINGLNMGCKRKREVKGNARFLSLATRS